MEKEKLLVSELSGLTGVELELSSDGICELAVEDRIVVLRYRPDDDDWLYFGVVAEPEDGPGKQMMEKALRLNLFGAETLGFHLGLFGKALILSGSAAMDGLTAETIDECDHTVIIPMAHGVDSLNVGNAAAVAFWALRQR